jgi:hypothetical protein
MDVYTFLVMLHVVGTILGTGGATVAELQIARALRDKRVSMDERALMHANYGMIRVGMAIILVSVLGMFWYFYAQGSDALFSNEKLWIKDLMFVMIFINAFAIQKRLVPLWLGASISFTSWWGATLLGLAGQLPYSFITYFIGYVIAIFAIAGLFHLLRLWARMGILNGRTTVLSIAIVLTAVALIVFQLIQGEQAREAVTDSESEVVAEEHQTLTELVTFAYPGGEHNVAFNIVVDENGVIQSIAGADVDPENQGRIADFVTSVNEMLVGKELSELEELDKVGGASLTTAAFNESIAKMQSKF